MNPACPIENWPVNPFTTVRLTARMMLMPATSMIFAGYPPNAGPAAKYAKAPIASPIARGQAARGRTLSAGGLKDRACSTSLDTKSDLFNRRPAQDSLGPEQQHQDENR